MTGKRKRTQTLRCEGLEARDCPATQIFVSGGVLVAIGDGGTNDITFTDLGNGQVAVAADGTFRVESDISVVAAATLGGDDSVVYQVAGPSVGDAGVDLVAVDGGDGSDEIAVSAGNLNGSLTFLATGGAGNDFMRATANGASAAANLVAFLNGAADDDTITAFSAGPVVGTMTLRMLGAAGNDTIQGGFDVQAGSLGTLSVRENGGPGDDNMSLGVTGAGVFSVNLDAVMNGAAGTDTGTATPNVFVAGIEL